MKNFLITIFLQILLLAAKGQSLGGTSVFNFLRYSGSPQLTALGGVNVSQQTEDISLVCSNPALLKTSMHSQLSANFSSFQSGFNNYQLVGGYYRKQWRTNLYGAINYFDYGSITETDASGNILGQIRPREYVVQVGASRSYGDHFNYGATLKFAQASYGNFRASGLALDVAVAYTDTANLIKAAIVLKNMGLQTKSFNGAGKESLPFDIIVGISKKLEKAPLQFTLTVHHLHQFNLRYNDSSFNEDNGFEQVGKPGVADKLLRHIVLSTQLFISDKVEISAGYNYLRRKELNIGSTGNGLNGFSVGVGVLVKKIQIRYARTFYQANFATNQFGLGFPLNSFTETHN